jgi:FixJ family two-component response regulator
MRHQSNRCNAQGGRAINREATVFIVDDTHEVRAGLSRLLSAAGYNVRAFESAERFLDERDRDTPGCLLLDFCLPGLNGLELQHRLVGSPIARPIVFLSGQSDIPTAVQAMRAGAVHFLTKPIDADRLFGAVEQAFKQDRAQRLERNIRISIQQRIMRLTPRERQVMNLVIHGRLNKQIAATLGAGEKTIKVHRARVMDKMSVSSVAELVRLNSRVGIAVEPALGRGADDLYQM